MQDRRSLSGRRRRSRDRGVVLIDQLDQICLSTSAAELVDRGAGQEVVDRAVTVEVDVADIRRKRRGAGRSEA